MSFGEEFQIQTNTWKISHRLEQETICPILERRKKLLERPLGPQGSRLLLKVLRVLLEGWGKLRRKDKEIRRKRLGASGFQKVTEQKNQASNSGPRYPWPQISMLLTPEIKDLHFPSDSFCLHLLFKVSSSCGIKGSKQAETNAVTLL